MPKIISFSGNLGSGKDTVGDNTIEFLQQKGYSAEKFFFSKALKEFAVNVLGLERQYVYGTQEDKNKATHLKWEDMPGVVIYDNDYMRDFQETFVGVGCDTTKLILHRAGHMTIREVLQFVGTEIGRRMYDNIWIDATFREIRNSDCDFAIITDARFHNELDHLLGFGSVLIRLLRQPMNIGLTHSSETQLDTYKKWTYIFDNRNLTKDEQKDETIKIIEKYLNV